MTTAEINQKWGAAFVEGMKRDKKHKSDKHSPEPSNPGAAKVTEHFQLWKKKTQNTPADQRKPKPKPGPKVK